MVGLFENFWNLFFAALFGASLVLTRHEWWRSFWQYTIWLWTVLTLVDISRKLNKGKE